MLVTRRLGRDEAGVRYSKIFPGDVRHQPHLAIDPGGGLLLLVDNKGEGLASGPASPLYWRSGECDGWAFAPVMLLSCSCHVLVSRSRADAAPSGPLHEIFTGRQGRDRG